MKEWKNTWKNIRNKKENTTVSGVSFVLFMGWIMSHGV